MVRGCADKTPRFACLSKPGMCPDQLVSPTITARHGIVPWGRGGYCTEHLATHEWFLRKNPNWTISSALCFWSLGRGLNPRPCGARENVPFRLRGGCSLVSRNIYQAEPPRHQANARQRFDLKLLPQSTNPLVNDWFIRTRNYPDTHKPVLG